MSSLESDKPMEPECDLFERLREVSVFAGLSEHQLHQLAALADIVTAPAGTLLFGEGEQHAELYFVVSGTIALDMVTPRSGKQPILTVGAGDLLAWSTLLGDGRMTASAVASEESRLITLPAQQILDLCESDRDLGFLVMRGIARLMSRRLLATRLQLLDLFGQ